MLLRFISLGGVGLAVLLLWLLPFQIFTIEGDSMEPTYRRGDTILIRKEKNYSARRGDIFVFKAPASDKLMVKRAVLLPEDTIHISNGYLKTKDGDFFLKREQWEALASYKEVPQRALFLAGDNQFSSLDSRDFGFVPYDSITGRVLFGKK